MTRRVLGYLIILFSILFLPYWIYTPVLFVAIIFFPFFWEGILFALLIDVVYGSGVWGPSLLFSSFAFYALITLIILLPIRERLRAYV